MNCQTQVSPMLFEHKDGTEHAGVRLITEDGQHVDMSQEVYASLLEDQTRNPMLIQELIEGERFNHWLARYDRLQAFRGIYGTKVLRTIRKPR